MFRNFLDSDVKVVRDDDNDDNGAAEPRDNDDDDGDDDDDDDFDIGFLVADDNDRGGGQVEDGRPGDPDAVAPKSLTGCEYGCKVLAFGCADHCAMGVPGARGGGSGDGGGGRRRTDDGGIVPLPRMSLAEAGGNIWPRQHAQDVVVLASSDGMGNDRCRCADGGVNRLREPFLLRVVEY